MDQKIQDFIDIKKIAVVGVSRNASKFGNLAYKELKERGYQVYAVNPSMQEFQGQPCYPNLEALQGQVDGVLLTIHPEQGKAVLEEASRVGIKKIWVQQQADSPALLESGRQLGLDLVSGKCILMYAPPVRSFHKFHRFINQIFGKL